MSRPLRVEMAGGVYHVTSRGDGREDIFLDDDDRQQFLAVLRHAIDRFGWRCLAYCLMTNHYHLLLETPAPNLARGMRQLNGIYTQRFNRRYGRVGHVFQGRYKALVVQKDRHLLELCRYVVLNPVRAGMVKRVQDWPWSSYRATAGQKATPEWLATDWLLRQFAGSRRQAIALYRRFVTAGSEVHPWRDLIGQIYYGDESFVQQVAQGTTSGEVPRRQRHPLRLTLATLVPTGTPEEIGRAYREHGYQLMEIARHLGVHYATVSRRLRRFEEAVHDA